MVNRTLNGRVLTLTMNRPEKRNALSAELVSALKEELQEAEKDPGVRVVVLTGAGKAFSAGADLAALQRLQEASFDENLADSRHLAGLFEAIDGSSKVIVARVNGHAIAGGCGLASVCDLSVAVDHAKLGFTEVRIGFVPAIVSVFLQRRVPELMLRDLLLTGRILSAEEAVGMGLLTRCVPAGELDEAVDALTTMLVRETSGQAIGATKELLRSLRGRSHADSMDAASHANARARASRDCLAGVAAFLSRTDPPWKADG